MDNDVEANEPENPSLVVAVGVDVTIDVAAIVGDEWSVVASCRIHVRAAADVPIVTAIRDDVVHLLPILAHAPSPIPKKNFVSRNSTNRVQYGFFTSITSSSSLRTSSLPLLLLTLLLLLLSS